MMMMMQGHMDDGMSASRIYQIYIDMIVEREDTKHTHPHHCVWMDIKWIDET